MLPTGEQGRGLVRKSLYYPQNFSVTILKSSLKGKKRRGGAGAHAETQWDFEDELTNLRGSREKSI